MYFDLSQSEVPFRFSSEYNKNVVINYFISLRFYSYCKYIIRRDPFSIFLLFKKELNECGIKKD